LLANEALFASKLAPTTGKEAGYFLAFGRDDGDHGRGVFWRLAETMVIMGGVDLELERDVKRQVGHQI